MTPVQLEFSTFCIGNIAMRTGLTQSQVYNKLCRSGILYEYVIKHYDTLHTYSRPYIVDDLVSLMRERKALL